MRSRFQLTTLAAVAFMLSIASICHAQLTWTVLIDHPSVGSTTRSLRGLALSHNETTLYGGFIQQNNSAGVRRYTLAGSPPVGTVALPFFNVTLIMPSGDLHQAEAVTTDDRGIVYAASIKDSTSGDNARVILLDSTLTTSKVFALLNIDFPDPTGETIGGLHLRKSGGVYQLYVARFRTLTPSSPYIERYVVGGTGVADATLTLDPTFNGTGRFAISGGAHLRGIDVAADGTIFVASRESNKVWRVPASLTGVTSVAVTRAMDLALYNDHVYVSRYDGTVSSVVELKQSTLAATGRVFTATGSFPHPEAATGYAGIDIDASGRIYLADQIYTGSSSDRILVSSPIPPLPGPPTLTLTPDNTCYDPGDVVTVTVEMTNPGEFILGGQFFLGYDSSKLTFLTASVGDPPFTLEVYRCVPTDPMAGDCVPMPGFINYATGVPLGNTTGTASDTTMAVFTFEADVELCDTAGLVYWRDNTGMPPDPPSRLTNSGGPNVVADLIDMPAITVDNTPPVLTAPPNAVVECDPSDPNALPGVLLGTAMGGVHIVYNGPGGLEVPSNQAYLKAQFSQLNTNGAHLFFDTALLPPYLIPGLTWQSLFSGLPPGQSQMGLDMVLPAPTWDLITPIPFLTAVDNTNGTCAGAAPSGVNPVIWAINDYKQGPAPGYGPDDPARCVVNSLMRSAGLAVNAVEITKNILTLSGTVYTVQIGGRLNSDGTIHWFNPLTPHSPMSNFGLTGTFYFDAVLTYDSAGDPGNDGDFYAGTITISANSPYTGANAVGVATVTDNCTALPVVTFSDVVTPGACPQEKTIVRTWQAVDDCGNTSTADQNITVQDTQPPVFTFCPADIVVDADVGGCDALVNVPQAEAVDCCDPAIMLTAVRSDSALLTDPFPAGVTTITWTATDACGNSSQCIQTVTVNAVNTMIVDIQLAGTFTTSFTRCIRFELWLCGGGPAVIVDEDISFVNGFAGSVAVTVPCGNYDCITARDRKHTLRRTDSAFGPVGPNYVADFTGADALVSGNLNDDFYIDILDFGILAGQYTTNFGTADTLCGALGNNADLNGDGLVFTGDFTFIQQNFLMTHEANCCGQPGFAGLTADVHGGRTPSTTGPITKIAVKELYRQGLGELAAGDVNRDGWLDQHDIAAFFGGANP